MDMYLYPFGDPAHPTVLKDVGYGDVSAYMTLGPGQYTVAMRGFDAPPSSHPALVSSFMVNAKTAYTVAALGPDPGLRVEVLKDEMTTPRGKTLVRVLQASLKENRVTVTLGSTLLTQQLAFSSATPYTGVAPGVHAVKIAASGEHATMSLGLTADTVHTIVVLDGSSGLKADDLTDAVGAQALPSGGAGTGLGGTALTAIGGPGSVAAGDAGWRTPHRRGRCRARLATPPRRDSAVRRRSGPVRENQNHSPERTVASPLSDRLTAGRSRRWPASGADR